MIASTSSRGEILPLTGLRFVAAFYVFLFHIHIRWPLTSEPFLKSVLDQGAIGMSLFFVLSGFVLCYQYAGRRVTYTAFIVARFARIYPIYLIAAILTLPWMGIASGDGSISGWFIASAQRAMLAFTNIFLIQAWFPQFFQLWNDGASWSISVEAFCYVLLPLVLPKLGGLSRLKLRVVLVVCLMLAALPGLSATLFDGPASSVFYSLPIFRLPEFMCGVCACLATRTERVSIRGTFSLIAVIVAFIVYLGIFGSKFSIYVGHNWLTIPVITFIIFTSATSKGGVSKLLSASLLRWLGKISYCFYSLQALLILLLIDHHKDLISSFPFLSNNLYLCISALIVLTIASAISHYLIEEPVRQRIKNMFRDYRNQKPARNFT